MEDCVPPEPMVDCGEKLSTFRIRFPDGTTMQRRFLANQRLKVQPRYSLASFPDEGRGLGTRLGLTHTIGQLVPILCIRT